MKIQLNLIPKLLSCLLLVFIAGSLSNMKLSAQQAPPPPPPHAGKPMCEDGTRGPGGKHRGGGADGARLSPTERASKMTEKMTKRYNLTKDQQAKISEINQSFADQSSRMRESEKQDRAEKFAQREQLRQQKEADIKRVLTPEQAKQFEADKQKITEKMDSRGQERRENRPPAADRAARKTEKMIQKLALNDKQAQAVKEINLKAATAIDKIMSNDKMDKGDRLKQIDQIEQQTERELRAVLTPEQAKQLEQIKAQRREQHGGPRGQRPAGGRPNGNNEK